MKRENLDDLYPHQLPLFPFDFIGQSDRADVLPPALEIFPAYQERLQRNLVYVVERFKKP